MNRKPEIEGEHQKWSREYWEIEAFLGDTYLGYWAWIAEQLEKDGVSPERIKSQVHESGLPSEVEILVQNGVASVYSIIGSAIVKIIERSTEEERKEDVVNCS